jgi:FkbM family methyltransferase
VADYQKHNLVRAISFVARRRLALDIGGHIGTSANRLSRIFRRVVTFEPAADTYACLLEIISARALSNVTAYNLALSDKRGSACLMPYSRDPGNVGARSLSSGDDVIVFTMDDSDFSDLDFIKIDVEGFEALVLLGGRSTLCRERPVIMFEERGLKGRVPAGTPSPQMILGDWGARLLLKMGGDEIWGWETKDSIASKAGEPSLITGD